MFPSEIKKIIEEETPIENLAKISYTNIPNTTITICNMEIFGFNFIGYSVGLDQLSEEAGKKYAYEEAKTKALDGFSFLYKYMTHCRQH